MTTKIFSASHEIGARIEDPKFVREFDRPRYVPHAHSLAMTARKEHKQSKLVEEGLVDRAGAFDDFDNFDFEKEFGDSEEKTANDKPSKPT
uniref:AGC-kinase C-terminal domain-containing protein n=1 Tax=Syphacia muris TaxID=451379 RepID=A0A0N5ASH5_9BILA